MSEPKHEGAPGRGTSRPLLAALLAGTLLGLAPFPAQAEQGSNLAPARSADQRLKALYEAEWAWRLKELGRLRGTGPGAYADYLPRVDPATQQRRLAYWTDVLRRLDQIPVDALSDAEQVNAAVFRTSVEEQVNDIKFRAYEMPFTSDSAFWVEIDTQQPFENADEYRRYLGRLRDIPRFFDEQVANMRLGLKRGFSVPRVTLAGRDKVMDAYLKADDTNPLFGPFRSMPSSMPEAERARLRAEASAVIRDAAVPAYRRLQTVVRDEYIPQARTTLGATQLPDGAAYYQAMIRKYTTLDITADEIHRIGLSEVARITAEMEETKRRAGFTGSLADFIKFLRTDPQFYARTPRELLATSAYVAKKADGKLRETIGTLPRYRHGIVAVPDAIAPYYTAGRGGLENCLMNTYNLPARPLYAIPALTLHECTPGHSFQAALALEGPDHPDFRKDIYFSGYGEGWGLYTEWLGTVMGIYETPYEDFGRLTYEMWRAARLVIDTGIHAYGWDRDRALAYLRDHTALSEHEVTTEIDRYISWPGQATAYKLGELQIRRLRKQAEETLGEKFDQRRFHDAILALGSVPLPVLDERIKAFIAAEGKTVKAGSAAR